MTISVSFQPFLSSPAPRPGSTRHRYRTEFASLIPPIGGRIMQWRNVEDSVFSGDGILGFLPAFLQGHMPVSSSFSIQHSMLNVRCSMFIFFARSTIIFFHSAKEPRACLSGEPMTMQPHQGSDRPLFFLWTQIFHRSPLNLDRKSRPPRVYQEVFP